MRLISVLSLVATLLTGTAHAAATVGQAAPAFTASNSNGGTTSLADLKGKFVVLEWTNDGCPFVQKHYSGNMQGLQKDATDKGAVWLSVISSAPGKQGNVDAKGANALSASRKAHPSQVLLDPAGDLGQLYGAKTTPHMFIINPEGTLIYAGGIDSIASADADDIPKATPYVRLGLTEAMAGKAITHPVTTPYGCSVKY
ncbi:MAG: redoxin domain-containing protein [Pseudomonadota bacterium]|nr:redoxin domain-containing protein [Pseudomonadota bacterium]